MELRNLKTFVTIAKLGSFTQAAELLGYAQSTITSQIQVLEGELNTKLFERLGRNIFLTSHGERLLQYAEQILKLSSEAADTMDDSCFPQGTLTVGAVESLCIIRLPEILKKYHKLYPKVDIIIKLGTCSELRNLLRNNTIDVAVILDRKVIDEDFVTKISVEEPMVVLSSPRHPIANIKSIIPQDLRGESIILTERGCSYRTLFEAMINGVGAYPRSILEVGSIQAIKQFTMSDLGITLLPLIAVEKELAEKQLIKLDWKGPEFNIMTQVIYHKDKWISPALKAFLDLLEEFQNI